MAGQQAIEDCPLCHVLHVGVCGRAEMPELGAIGFCDCGDDGTAEAMQHYNEQIDPERMTVAEADSLREQLLAIHQPVVVEIEVFFETDDGDLDELHAPWDATCTDSTNCPGHVTTIESCDECGEDGGFDGNIVHLKWPCRTARLLGVAESGVGQAAPDSAIDELVTVDDWWLCAFHQDLPDFYCCQRTQMPECVPVRTYFQRGEYRRAAIDGAPNARFPSNASRALWPERSA